LFSLCRYVFTSGKFLVQMYVQVFYFFSLGQLFVLYLDRTTRLLFVGKVTWTDFVSLAFIRHFSPIIGFCLGAFVVCVFVSQDLRV
jgi:hypothetical protein